jgi:hypothetical protein
MVPSMGTQSGGPSVTISSVGDVVTITSGPPFLSEAFCFVWGSVGPVIGSMTFCLASVDSRVITLGGTFAAGVHGPAIDGASTKPSKR